MEVKPGYKQTEVGVIPEDWGITSIGSLASFKSGDGISIAALAEESSDAPIPVYGGNGIAGYTDRALVQEPVIVIGRVGQKCGEVHLTEGPAWITDNALYPRSLLRRVDVRFLALALKAAGLNNVKNRNDLPLVTQSILHSVRIPLPPTLAEQEAIAEALSDADTLIESLEQLLVKKRQLKQGAMQELLTGKKRLPGFSGEWETRAFDGVLSRVNAKVHQIQTSDYQTTGRYPVVDQGKERVIGFSDRQDKRFQCPEGGVIVFGDHTCIVKFVDFDFLVGADGTQVLEAKSGQCTRFHALQLQHSGVTPTGYNRHFKFLKEREFVAPPRPEQIAIATILSDMDAEIAALETKLAKARQIKQGMMQELLTGKIRLV